MLKNSLLEKNQQIEALLKKNKLLAYQIEEINRQKEDDSNKNALRIEIDQYKQEKEDLLGKMN